LLARPIRKLIVVIKWDSAWHSATTINENGISQVIEVLEAQEIKETGNEED
jgi:hypothetical protein